MSTILPYIAFTMPRDKSHPFLTIAGFALLFGLPLLCIAGLIFLVRDRRRFGGATLHLKQFPLRIGDELVGELETDKPLEPTSMNIRLKCVRRISKRYGSYDHKLWKYEYQVQPDVFRSGAHSIIVPVRITISDRGKKTSVGWLSGEILWLLEVEAKAKRPHFDATFIIPVQGRV